MQYTIEVFSVGSGGETGDVVLTTEYVGDFQAAKEEAVRILRTVQHTVRPDGVRLKDESGEAVFTWHYGSLFDPEES
jgi:hypothetical protein